MKEKARAKLNFLLNVKGKRGDLHEIDTVIVPIPLCDDLTLTARSDRKVTIRYDGVEDKYERDPAKSLAEKIVKKYALPGVDIAVEKHIPEGAGLGGSSTDAAAVARGLEKLFSFGKVKKELLTEAGSDVYAAYLDVPCRVRGTGDEVDPVEGLLCPNVILLYSDFGVSTAECYKKFDEIGGEEGDAESVIAAMREGRDFSPKNGLLKAALALRPELRRVLDGAKESGLRVGMTGSGSAVFAFGYDKELFLERIVSIPDVGEKAIFLRE